MTLTGGAGGAGGAGGLSSADSGGGGGGGEGGQGALVTGVTQNTNDGTIVGGMGGTGGNAGGSGHYGPDRGGAGGDGGVGVELEMSGATLTNSAAGAIRGGTGGQGGTGLSGATGGTGGTGVSATGSTIINDGTIDGGSGGVGGSGGANGGGGTGIGGGTNTITNNATISGGAGGGADASGGAGIDGSGDTITNNSLITGGTGGGGNSTGGAGIVESNDRVTNTVSGLIQGGNGTGTGSGGTGIDGAGGTYVVNAGTINGGLGGGSAKADAIVFTNGGNTLELRSTSTITGTVSAGSTDTFALGGSADQTFDTTQLGASSSAAQYQGFGVFQKLGTSKWTLTGAPVGNTTTPWTITGGALRISDDASLGNPAGQLTFAGGTLEVTADTTSSRGLSVNGGVVGTIDVDPGATYTVGGVISGSGALNKVDTGTLVLTGDSTYTGGTTITAATLQLGDGSNSGNLQGSIDVQAAGVLTLDGVTGTLANSVSGAGAMNLVNSTNVTATGDNSAFSGSFEVASDATLTAGARQNLGTAALADAGTVNLDAYQGTLANAVSGTGAMNLVNGASVTATGDNSAFSGSFEVASDATLTAGARQNLGTAAFVDNGTLALDTPGAFTLGNSLTGNGLVTVDTARNAFDFAPGTGSAFAGMVAMGPATFALGGANATALTNSTLRSDTGSVTTVADGNQHIGGLSFNGGTVVFDAQVPGQSQASSMITVNRLDASGRGTVTVALRAPYVLKPPGTPDTVNLLEQDDANIGVKLVNATSTTGSGAGLALVDQNGQPVSSAQQIDVAQGGSTVATATYDYGLSTAPGDGLYVNYGLKQLDLHSGLTLTLAEDAGATGAAADMSARITGSGNLAIDAGAGTVALSNTTNDYTGDTTVASGTLRTDVDRALGNTSTLHIANAATADLNGTTQAIQRLDGQSGSTLNVNGGTLNITNGGTSAGSLTGAGQLSVNGGTLEVQGANTGLTARTAIAAGATAQVDDAEGLGSGVIVTDGTLVMNLATDGTHASALSGTGELVKQGSGTLTLSGQTGWTGITRLEGGEVVLDGANGGAQLVSNLVGTSGTSLSLQHGATLTGSIDPTSIDIDAASTWYMTESSQVDNVNLAGAINLAAPAAPPMTAGRTLTARNWVGQGGTVELYTVLAGDQSVTDRIVIDGGRATGNTSLTIKHAGGTGAQTNRGILVVETLDGATTDPTAFSLSAASDGYRAGEDVIAAGPYDYSLVRGGNGGVADDWYLSSAGATCTTHDTLCTPVSPSGADPSAPVLRPEVGTYLNNRLFAQTMQFHTLHERQSQIPGMVARDLGQSSDANTWVRVVGKTSRREGALPASDTSYLVHAGADVVRLDVGDGSIRIGAMGAYGSSDNHAGSGTLNSRGTVEGYNVGIYGTWYGLRNIMSGPYVDSWLMYGRFNNQVSGQGLPAESYRSGNLSASLEAGYAFPIFDIGNTRMYVEPEGQVIVSDYQADDHMEANGTLVSGQSGTAVTTRLGLRLHGDVKDDVGRRGMHPFAEMDWWNGPASQGIAFDGVTVRDGLPADRLESKVGLQGNLNKAVSVWGSVGFEIGAHDYTAGAAQIGVKCAW